MGAYQLTIEVKFECGVLAQMNLAVSTVCRSKSFPPAVAIQMESVFWVLNKLVYLGHFNTSH